MTAILIFAGLIAIVWLQAYLRKKSRQDKVRSDTKFNITASYENPGNKKIAHTTTIGGDSLRIEIPERAKAYLEQIARKPIHTEKDLRDLHSGYWIDVNFKGETHNYNEVNDIWSHSARQLPELQQMTDWIKNKINYSASKWERRPAKVNIKTPTALPEIDFSSSDELSKFVQGIGDKFRKERYYRASLASGQDFGVGVSGGCPWLDIIARNRRKGEKGGFYTGPYEISGFHVVESRWAYSDGPPGAMEIRKLLSEHFGTPEKIGRFK